MALGNTAAGALACANLGVMKEEVDAETGKKVHVKETDAELIWAMSQSIPASTSTGASDRARTTKLLHSAQTIVIDHVTGLIKAASNGGENSGCFTPTPTMVSDMLKGMIVGSRPHVVRKTVTMVRHDHGPWMCVPMNVINRPTTTMQFFEWYYSVGAYSEEPRQLMVAEDALSNWCKVIDALGQVYMSEFRKDCAEYVVTHNDEVPASTQRAEFSRPLPWRHSEARQAQHGVAHQELALAQATAEGRLHERFDGFRHVQRVDPVRPAEAYS